MGIANTRRCIERMMTQPPLSHLLWERSMNHVRLGHAEFAFVPVPRSDEFVIVGRAVWSDVSVELDSITCTKASFHDPRTLAELTYRKMWLASEALTEHAPTFGDFNAMPFHRSVRDVLAPEVLAEVERREEAGEVSAA